MILLLKWWKFAVIGALLVTIAVMSGTIAKRNNSITDLKERINQKNLTIVSLGHTIQARDAQLKDVGKTGAQDYGVLSKQCSANSAVWFDRGVAVGKSLCMPNPAGGGQGAAPDSDHPTAKR